MLPAFALLLPLLTACSQRQTVLPDETVPHRLARPAVLTLWVRRTDGLVVEQTVSVPAGWWLAAPRVVE